MKYPVTTYWPRPELFRLEENYYVTVDGLTIFVPKGFIYDGASIPKPLRGLVSVVDLGLGAAAVHDWGYEHGGVLYVIDQSGAAVPRTFTRQDVDRFLLHISRLENTRWWKRTYSLPFVRLFGKWTWNKSGHKEEELV